MKEIPDFTHNSLTKITLMSENQEYTWRCTIKEDKNVLSI